MSSSEYERHRKVKQIIQYCVGARQYSEEKGSPYTQGDIEQPSRCSGLSGVNACLSYYKNHLADQTCGGVVIPFSSVRCHKIASERESVIYFSELSPKFHKRCSVDPFLSSPDHFCLFLSLRCYIAILQREI